MAGRTDRDQQSNKTADRAQSATGGGSTGSGANDGRILSGDRLNKAFTEQAAKNYASKHAGGGSTTSTTYTPGAVNNYPDADLPTVAEKILGPLMPGGSLLAAAGALTDDGSLLGDPGPQKGYQPDRYRGEASLTGVGGSGGAVNGGDEDIDERQIAGQSLGAGTLALTGDTPDESAGAGTDLLYSDVTLRDRRKPRDDLGAGARMALQLQ